MVDSFSSYPFNSGNDYKHVLDKVSKHYKVARTAGMTDNKNADYQDYTLVGQASIGLAKRLKPPICRC